MKIKIKSEWSSYSPLWDISDITSDDKNIIYTDHKLQEVDLNIPIRIAWILESPAVNIYDYNWIEKNNNKFSYVFTHEKKLLDKGENYLYCPGASTWIYDQDRKIYDKNKLLSIISSSRNFLIGHKLRHQIISKYKNMDVFGNSGCGGRRLDDISDIGYNPIDNKIDGLKDYAFSIVVENTKSDYYWSEKLIDCFVTGTIPIYWGCPSIGNFFNTDGMIIFNNIDDLDNILNNLSFEKYENMKKYIINNFEISKIYSKEPIEFIYNNYSYLFI